MKKLICLLSLVLILPIVYSVTIGTGVTPDIRTENFKPMVWLCDSRAVLDDNTEPGRLSTGQLYERINNYAFEGEQIEWKLLVMDKNGIEKLEDVFVSIGPYNDARRWVTYYYNDTNCMNGCQSDFDACYDECYVPDYNQQCLDTCLPTCTVNAITNQTCVNECYDDCYIGQRLDQQCVGDCNNEKKSCQSGCLRTGRRLEQNDIEANCNRIGYITPGEGEDKNRDGILDSCNARILEETVGWNSEVMEYYGCTFTVETPDSMYGEYWVTLEVEDLDGLYNYADEVEYWFLNPVVALSIDGSLEFENVRPGTQSYSSTLLVGNDADEGSGVLLDMFISGTDFYDSSSSGAMCPTTNQLSLSRFAYFTTNGAYSSSQDTRPDKDGIASNDGEGYTGINYGIGFNNPTTFYGTHEILQAGPTPGGYYLANILAPGAEMALTFRLSLPVPCNGDFDTGSIFFWGEAI